MKKAMVLGVAAALAVLAHAAPATAQQSPVTISIAGGPSFPMGDLGDFVDTGYHVQGSAGFTVPFAPVALRADLLWQEFPADGDFSFRQIGGFINGSVGLPMTVARPYLIGGVGLVNNDASLGEIEGDSETEFGWAVGGGIDFGFVGLTGFLEARYMGAGEGNQALPVSVGIRF